MCLKFPIGFLQFRPIDQRTCLPPNTEINCFSAIGISLLPSIQHCNQSAFRVKLLLNFFFFFLVSVFRPHILLSLALFKRKKNKMCVHLHVCIFTSSGCLKIVRNWFTCYIVCLCCICWYLFGKNTGKSHIVCSTVCPVCVYVVHMLTTVFYCYCFQITKGSSDDRDANMKELA